MDFGDIGFIGMLAIGRWVWKFIKKREEQRKSEDHTNLKNRTKNAYREGKKEISGAAAELEKAKRSLTNVFQEISDDLGGFGKELVDEISGNSKKVDINMSKKQKIFSRETDENKLLLKNTTSEGGNNMQKIDLQNSQQVFNTKIKEVSNPKVHDIGAYSIRTGNRNRIKLEFNKKAVINGIIMAEVLGKPRVL